MNTPLRSFLVLLLATAVWPVQAQGLPPPPPAPGGPGQLDQRDHRGPWRELSPEEREQRRAEHRERREAWRNMTPEERQQLRRDIRDSAETLYPRGRQPKPD